MENRNCKGFWQLLVFDVVRWDRLPVFLGWPPARFLACVCMAFDDNTLIMEVTLIWCHVVPLPEWWDRGFV